MAIFIISFIVFALLLAVMAIGVLFGRKPIAGSCGGMNRLGLDTSCELCGGNPAKCDATDSPVDTSLPARPMASTCEED